MAYGVVYRITNTFNDKIYIGQTTRTVEQRFKEHMDSPYLIGIAMRALGVENFTIEVIEECETQEQLNEREIAKIAEYGCMAPNGYNLTEGGEGGSPCEETVEKIRASINAYYEEHPEARDRISAEQKARFSDPEEVAKQAERVRKAFENPDVVARHSASQKKRFEDPAERDKVAVGVSNYFSQPGAREAQSVRISAYFDTPGAREKAGAAQSKRFEDPEERKKVAIGVLKYLAEHGSRAHTDESKDKIRVKRLAYFARLRLQKVAGENQAAAEWNVSAQDLKVFHAENPDAIKPHSTDDRKAQTEIKRAAKRLAAVMTQNKTAAKLKNLSALGKYHAEHFDATKKHSAVVYDYTAERIASRREAAKRGNAKKRVERLPRMVARENQLAARLPELFKLKIYLSRLEQGNSQVLKNDSGSNR